MVKMFFEFNCKELFLKDCVLLRFHRQKCAGEKHLLVGRNVRIRNVSFSIHKIRNISLIDKEINQLVHIPGKENPADILQIFQVDLQVWQTQNSGDKDHVSFETATG